MSVYDGLFRTILLYVRKVVCSAPKSVGYIYIYIFDILLTVHLNIFILILTF